MDRDWSRLGAKLAHARKAVGLKQPEMGERIGVGRATIQKIEAGTPFKNITPAIRDYAEAVGWTYDSVVRVLGGGEPESVAPPAADDGSPRGLSPAVEMELRSGRTLDSTVVHIGPENADARIIVVLKGDVDITEEEVEQLMTDWRRKRRHLQSVATDPDASPDT
ncbi:helix-turn-helix transcriptional regulator [Streptomyces sp. NPDC046465]|uniref:helix-turn-helix domain-containing protein n=1 Tax=Streptomyces sp. NPDC046465 TaxID=3155810 RepID=UPI0033F8A31B